jgi:hypothetical protein
MCGGAAWFGDDDSSVMFKQERESCCFSGAGWGNQDTHTIDGKEFPDLPGQTVNRISAEIRNIDGHVTTVEVAAPVASDGL